MVVSLIEDFLLPANNPVKVFKALRSLEVIWEEKVVGECDQNLDEVGA